MSTDSKSKKLDLAIKAYEDGKGCYKMKSSGVCYEQYMSNNDWEAFLEKISPEHKRQYNNGGGGELKEKRYPPKMASYGSSSRFIYLLAKDIKGFRFEEKLPTHVGGEANLDGFYDAESTTVCIEAKCHEIYSTSHGNGISEVYLDVYKFLKDEEIGFDFEETTTKEAHKHNVIFSFGGQPILHLDIKQLICHFLGIAADLLGTNDHKVIDSRKPVKFVYLIYNPKDLKKELQKDYESIDRDYKATINELTPTQAKTLFDAVMQYQREHLNNAQACSYSFDFTYCDQSNFVQTIES